MIYHNVPTFLEHIYISKKYLKRREIPGENNTPIWYFTLTHAFSTQLCWEREMAFHKTQRLGALISLKLKFFGLGLEGSLWTWYKVKPTCTWTTAISGVCMYVYIYISKYVQAQSHLNLHTYSTIPNDILQARSFRPQWKHCLFQTEAISNKQTNTTQVHTLSNNHGNEDMAKQKNYPWREPLPWLFGVLATGCNWHFPPLAPPKQLQHQPFSFLVWLYTLYSKDIWNWFIYIYINNPPVD